MMKSDLAIPKPALLFNPAEDHYGVRLALVFGNEAPAGRCPFYGRQCYHCDIGEGEGAQFDSDTNARRLKFFQHHYARLLPEVVHLVLYNSGSVLNPRELSAPTLEMLLKWAAALPRCQVVSLDSREGFVTARALRRVLDCLREDQRPRPILGLETQDEHARLELLHKQMPRSAVAAAFETAGAFGGRVGLDVNIVFGLPPFSGLEAILEAQATALFALELGKRFAVSVDFNFHPYYPSRVSRRHFPDHPRCDLAAAQEAVVRVVESIRQMGARSFVFVGLNDEAHDQEPAARKAELSRHQKWFRQFNQTQTDA